MATERLLQFFEDEFFDKKDFQEDLPTYFDDEVVDVFIKDAISKGKKRPDWTEAGFEKQKENWRDVLDDHKAPELDSQIIKNRQKDANELQKIDTDFAGQERINERVQEIAKTESEKITSDYFDSIGVTRKSIRTVSNALNLSEEDTQAILEREGFSITEDGRIKK